MKAVVFNKQGYDPFLDFIKAWAILCVLFGHTFPYLNQVGYSLWLANQVPLFILIQTFHSYKKNIPRFSFKKIRSRVIIPFVVCEAIVFSWLLLRGFDYNDLVYKFLHYGGFGKGAYYPWIYLQMAVLLPLVHPLLKKMPPPPILLLLFLVVCEGLEILCSIIDLPDWIYRLLSIRYFFLVYLALIWIKKGIEPNRKMLVLSLLSLATIVYFRYFSVNDEPWFYNTAWKTARWPCYYYVANLYVYMLYIMWIIIKKYSFVSKCIKRIAASTYEIFLVQMSVIYLFHREYVRFVTNGIYQYLIWIVIVWSVSIGLGILVNKLINRNSKKSSLCIKQ